MTFKGKNAVITGGGRGIGRAVAEAYAREGAKLLLVSRTKSELEETVGRIHEGGAGAEILILDVAETDAPRLLREAIENVFPEGLDILVAAAGVYGPIGATHEVDPNAWRQVLMVNLFGTFAAVQASVPSMKKRERGTIITFSGGGEGPYPNFSAYVSSKGGIVRLTETLAVELAPFRIAVNAITPGAVNTRFLDELLAAGPEKAGEEAYQRSLEQKAEGGVSPEEAAKLCIFLASQEAEGVTGKVISANRDNYRSFPEHLRELMESDVYTFRRVKPKDRNFSW